jgi:Cu/Ag efflux pump CusA
MIDLDNLLPEPTQVKISGRVLNVYPGKLKALIKLQKVFLSFADLNKSDQMNKMEEVVEALGSFIPELKENDVDISLAQLPKIVEIAYQTSMPETEETQKQEMTPQKKTE